MAQAGWGGWGSWSAHLCLTTSLESPGTDSGISSNSLFAPPSATTLKTAAEAEAEEQQLHDARVASAVNVSLRRESRQSSSCIRKGSQSLTFLPQEQRALGKVPVEDDNHDGVSVDIGAGGGRRLGACCPAQLIGALEEGRVVDDLRPLLSCPRHPCCCCCCCFWQEIGDATRAPSR